MIIFVALLLILSLYKCKPIFNKGFHEDYASRDQSRAINGICIMLILLSHTFAKVAPALPYLVFTSIIPALVSMLAIIVLIIAGFTYYTSVAKDEPFKSRFLEMSLISLGVAVLSFGVGLAAKALLGVDI